MLTSGIRTALLLAVAGSVTATPFTWGDKIVKPLSFPPGSTITVYVQPDPQGKGRDALVKEGIDRWKDLLTAHNITLDVKIQAPPASPPQDSMTVKFVPDGTKLAGSEVGPSSNDGVGSAVNSATRIVRGETIIRDSMPATTDTEKDALRNIGQHEVTHMLGLDDDDTGKVTNHNQDDQPRTKADYNDRDKAELNQLYAASNTGGTGFPTGVVTATGGGAALGYYDYSLNFTAAGDPLTDPQHVALINLGIDPEFVTGIDLPSGWESYVRHGTADPADPYFNGILVDGAPGHSPFDPVDPINYIPIRNVDPAAALSTSNPTLNLRVHTDSQARDGWIQVYAGGSLQTVAGPVMVPEPAFLPLAGALFLLPAIIRRKRRGCATLVARDSHADSGGGR